jgi:polar amino acid transport system substrate-binding protein
MIIARRNLSIVSLFALAATCIFLTSAPARSQDASALSAIKSRKELKIGWAPIYPYIYRDPKTNELIGFAVDFMNDMAQSLGVKPVWVEDGWATMIAGLQSKKFDITVPAMGVTLPRAEVVTFTDPVCRMPVGLVIQKKDSDKYSKLADLDKPDKKITVTLGSTTDLFATRKFSKAQLVRMKQVPDSLAQLLAGKVDAWANPADASGALEKEHPELVTMSVDAVGSAPMAMAIRQGDYVFRDWVNLFIDYSRRLGTLKKLVDKHGLYEWKVAGD